MTNTDKQTFTIRLNSQVVYLSSQKFQICYHKANMIMLIYYKNFVKDVNIALTIINININFRSKAMYHM
jgi:hypothetical protein